MGYTATLTRPPGTLSHPMGEGWGVGLGVAHPADQAVHRPVRGPLLPVAPGDRDPPDPYSKDSQRGTVRGVHFRDITVAGSQMPSSSFRGFDAGHALEVFPQVPRLEMPPMIISGNLLWRRGKMVLGLPEDRISGVSARANAEFSTKAFMMPDADLLLNAAVPAPERSFGRGDASVLAEARRLARGSHREPYRLPT